MSSDELFRRAERNDAMNKPTKQSLPVSALVTIVAAFAIPARAEGPVARVPAVQENSTNPDLKAMFDTKTPRPLVELAILRTAQLWEGDYEMNQHRPMMRACGYTPQQIEAVGYW